jgi:hypothetical protein
MDKAFDALMIGDAPAMRSGISSLPPAEMLNCPGVIVQKTLTMLIGPEDSRYPPGSPGVIALEFADDEWLRVLFLPDREWHALAGAGRRSPVLRLMLPPGPRAAAGVSRLAKRFPHTRFLIDPFRHGPEPAAGWQSQVCLAEHENVWITTLGLVPGQTTIWNEPAAIHDALYFVIGEVGAGKLLFASGLIADNTFDARAWLTQFPFLDEAQRELILRSNAKDLFQ